MGELREEEGLTVNALAGDAFICGDITRVKITSPDGTVFESDMALTKLTIDEEGVVRKRYVMVERADP